MSTIPKRRYPQRPRISRRADPTRLEIFKNIFHSIAEEMGATLRRSAFSPNIKERRDYSCAVYDRVRLGAGDEVTGPAVLEEFSSTVPLHPGFTARVDAHGNLVVGRSARVQEPGG
jgi:N-methylhydantoinase A/oxoprolinase/acetone carboxylase beta subunit